MATFAFYTQGLYTYFINKTFFSLCSYFKSKDISFSNCKALKHNKRQERNKGIEPSTQESPNQHNQTKPRYHQLLPPQDQAPRLLIRQHWWQRLCALQQSLLSLIHHLFTFCVSFLFKEKGKKEITSIHSFASSPWSCDSNLHLILLQYSGGTGASGSCSEQQRRPSSAEGTRAPFPWSLQKECGQNSQKETAALLHSSHWCHGHSHFPSRWAGREEP